MSCGKRQFAFEVCPAQYTYRQWTHLSHDVKKAGKVVEKIPLLLHVSSVSDLPRGIRKKAVEMRRILISNRSHGPTDRQKTRRRRRERRGATRRELRTRKQKRATRRRRGGRRTRPRLQWCEFTWKYENSVAMISASDSSQHFRALYLNFDVASARLLTTWQRRRGALCSFGVRSFTRATPICVI